MQKLSTDRSSMIFEDCPICLETMDPSDHEHPLQCSNHCGFNFCKNCIESLIVSSKDDYVETSDGSYRVKVFLRCPNCRSDLKLSIRNTLLLRKTDMVPSLLDCKISLSELHTKSALEYPQVQEAIREAQRVEAMYLGNEPPLEHVEYDEVGFEVDLSGEVNYKPFSGDCLSLSKKEIIMDPTVLGGLDCLLNYDERIYVMDLMTSGDPSQVADAAQILFSVGSMNKFPQQAHQAEATVSPLTNQLSLEKKASILRLVAESQEEFERHVARERGIYITPSSKTQKPQPLSGKIELESRIPSARLRTMFPLPTRIPKCVEINLVDKFDFKLVDSD